MGREADNDDDGDLDEETRRIMERLVRMPPDPKKATSQPKQKPEKECQDSKKPGE
jgi:hypothetical protein